MAVDWDRGFFSTGRIMCYVWMERHNKEREVKYLEEEGDNARVLSRLKGDS